MNVDKYKLQNSLLLAGLVAVTMSIAPKSAEAQDADAPTMVVVVNNKAPIKQVTHTELSRLFLTLSRDISGEPATPINLDDQALKIHFVERVTGRTQRSIEKHFVGLELRGEGRWPAQVPSAQVMGALLMRSARMMVGWMPLAAFEALDPATREKLRIISIDGKTPGMPEYLLGP